MTRLFSKCKKGLCVLVNVVQNPVLDYALSNCGQLLTALCWYKRTNLYTCKFSTCGESLFMARNKTLLSFKTPMLCGQVKSADRNSNSKSIPQQWQGCSMINQYSCIVLFFCVSLS